jgi:polar amino acid transport system permease protein
VGALVVLLLAVMAAHSLFFSEIRKVSDSGNVRVRDRFEWDIISKYFTSEIILKGLVVTLQLTVIAMVLGIVLGILMAVFRLSPNPLVSGASWLYIWFFRGTPVYVQLLFWYGIGYIFPEISLGIPFGPEFVHIDMNVAITPYVAAIVGLGLNEGAYMAEIVRAGILSVDEGQTEAAHALGMSRLQTMRRIVLPQAMRVIAPPTGNEVISMLKTTSLAAAITVGELTNGAHVIYSRTYQTIPLLMVASCNSHRVVDPHGRAVLRRVTSPVAPCATRPRRSS